MIEREALFNDKDYFSITFLIFSFCKSPNFLMRGLFGNRKASYPPFAVMGCILITRGNPSELKNDH